MPETLLTEPAPESDLVAPTETESPLDQQVRDQFVSTYLQNNRRAQIGLLLSAVVVALIWHGRVQALWPLAWLFVFTLITALRYFGTDRFVLSAPNGAQQTTRIALTLLMNGVWMALPLVAFGDYSELERISVSIILMATATASTTTTTGYRSIFLWFAAPMLVPLSMAWGLAPHENAGWLSTWGVSVLILFYTGFLVSVARQVATVFEQSCRHRLGEQETNLRLSAALEQADESNRAKTHFLAAASHDLRQPLHSINVLVAALTMRKLDDETTEIVQLLDSVNHTMSRQLDALLDLSKLDAGIVVPRMATHRLDVLLESLAQSLQPVAAEQGIAVELENWPQVHVRTDDVLLRRILSNLTDNALKFTPRGGRVHLKLWQTRSQVHVSVTDSGTGIAPEHQKRVFQEFYQVGNTERDRRKGLGLGLSIVHRLCQLLTIKVELASRIGLGTTFTLSMPRTQGHLSSPEPRSSGAIPDLDGLNVLVVDDEAIVRQSMGLLLRQLGCTVHLADGTAQAMLLARQNPIDVLLSDQRLRGADNGLRAIAQVRALHPQVTVALVTGDTAPDRIALAEDAGIPLLYKPLELDRVLELLRRARRGSQTTPP